MQVVLVVLLAYTIIQGIIQLFYYAYLNEFFNEKFYLWPSFYGLHLAWKRIVAAKKIITLFLRRGLHKKREIISKIVILKVS